MLRHNIKLAFRNFKKDKSTFLINLIGLSTGLACAIMIFMWVNDEWSVDKFHENDAQLFRVFSNYDENGKIATEKALPPLLAKAMEEELPEVKLGASSSGSFSTNGLTSNDIYLSAKGRFVTDNFFQLFSFEMLEGDKYQIFPNKSGIVISEKLAKKFYPNTENILGKIITYESGKRTIEAFISGVFKDLPKNSTFQFDYLLSFDLYLDRLNKDITWNNYIAETYVLLHEDVALNDFNNKIEKFLTTKHESTKDILWAQKFTEGYLQGEYREGKITGGRITYVRLFSLIALFILLIACINFMNLSTANATKKFKEIGVKKTIGADRQTLIFQYLSESMMLSFFSLFIAFGLIYSFLPSFNLITGKELSLEITASGLVSIFGITLLTGFISGSYPAFYLSGFKPARIFKGNIKNSWGELWARKGLVVFQFAISIILIVSVVVIFKQIEFIQNKKLGFNRDNVVHFYFNGSEAVSQDVFISEIKKIPSVVNASSMEGGFVNDINDTNGDFNWEGKDPNFDPQYKKDFNIDLKELAANGKGIELFIQPVTDIHLHSAGFQQPYEAQGDFAQVKMFGIIALFILLIALINFINLSTARSANRAKEVGLRKVLGSFQKQLVSQFLTESVLMSVLAFSIGISFAFLLIPMFNELSGKNLSIPFSEISFLPFLFGGAILTGILAGLYPSFYLSAFQPVKVLKGKLSLGSKSGWLRSGLVVFQFAISITLIVGTVVVYQQMSFINNKKLGFQKDQVLLIQDTHTIFDQLPEFKNAIKNLPEAKNAALSSSLPLDGGNRNSVGFVAKGNPNLTDVVAIQRWMIDEDYINTLSMDLVEGRNFSQERLADSASVILNQTAVQTYGFSGNPIGQVISTPDGSQDFTVIGVVEDFHFESLKGKVKELALFMGMSSSVVSVKTTANEMDKLIAKSEATWKSFAPTQPFRYDFLDDRFAKMYKAEDRISKLFGIFSLLAIFIACLGLLALATFMTEQRMKEIGIRKVLGASVPNIVFTLSKSFLAYVIFGLLIATPIAWIQMGEWLNNFENRIDLEWWMFAFAGVMAIGIAFLTVGSKSLIAALTNPVYSLKSE